MLYDILGIGPLGSFFLKSHMSQSCDFSYNRERFNSKINYGGYVNRN